MSSYCITYTKKYYNKDTNTLEEVDCKVVPTDKWLKSNNYNFKKLAQKHKIKDYKLKRA